MLLFYQQDVSEYSDAETPVEKFYANYLDDENFVDEFGNKPIVWFYNSYDDFISDYDDEEDFFEMLDHVNPKNIIKYLDMRRIPHRDSLEITVTENKVRLSGKASPEADKVRRGLYNSNKRNRIKLNRALELLDNLKTEGKA